MEVSHRNSVIFSAQSSVMIKISQKITYEFDDSKNTCVLSARVFYISVFQNLVFDSQNDSRAVRGTVADLRCLARSQKGLFPGVRSMQRLRTQD